MFKPYTGDGPEPIGFFITPQFSLLFFLSIFDPLRVANEISGRKLFSYKIISEKGGLVQAFNGMSILSDVSISEVDFMPSLIVCSGYQPEKYTSKSALAWLRQHARRGAQLGAVDTGCTFLAKAGLLDGYRVTMHWQVIDSFREQFPKTRVTDDLFEVDRDRFTCAGGSAGFEMMLAMIAQKHGNSLAAAIADQFIHSRIRRHTDLQREATSAHLRTQNPALLKAIDIMEQRTESLLAIPDVARYAGVSKRQLERMFNTHLKDSPSGYYLKIRLRRARYLLQQTSNSIIDIATSCGFSSASHFSRAYKKHFGKSPREDREMGVFIIS